jgi:trehalose/maltose transport system substrate-binding protein
MRKQHFQEVTPSECRASLGDPERVCTAYKIGVLGVLLLSFGLACSRQPSHKPVTITFLDLEWDIHDRLPGLAQDLQEFTRETGIQVKRLPGPDGSLNQLALWRQLLEKGNATPDVCNIDVVWSGILSPYLMDLKPYLAAEASSQDPAVVASYTVRDKLVAVPHHAYVGVLFYRNDLLRRYGFREPPKTWEELETIALRIQMGERAQGRKEFWGYVWEGAPDEDLTCGALEWQVSTGGGRIIEEDQTISVNNQIAIRSWLRAKNWAGSISPHGVAAYSKWDAENAWGAGKAAFLRGWTSDYSLITLHPPPARATQYGVTSVPGSEGVRVSTLGGNGLAVPRRSAHPREAMEMIRFLRRRDAQLRSARDHSEVPKELELYELPRILNPFPQLANLQQPGGGVVARPSVVTGQKYEEVSRAFIRQVHAVLTGEKNPSLAAAALEQELVAITGFRTGPPSKRNW